MKKLNNKGFMLTEVLIVSTLVVTVLLVMYTQFKTIKRNFDRGFKYNTVNDIYNLYNVKKYIENENFINMAGRLDYDHYVDISSCNSNYYSSNTYCQKLYDTIGIKKLYLIHTNLEHVKNVETLPKKTIEYIDTLKSTSGYGYRLIAEFDNDRYASLKVFSGSKYKAAITNSCNTANKLDYKIFHRLDSTNQDIKEATIKKGGCGEVIELNKEVLADKCYKAVSYSSDRLTISTDLDNNKGIINYVRKTAVITLNYRDSITNLDIKNARVVTLNCGEKFEIDDYIDTITGYEFLIASKTEVEVGTDDISIYLYYESGE